MHFQERRMEKPGSSWAERAREVRNFVAQYGAPACCCFLGSILSIVFFPTLDMVWAYFAIPILGMLGAYFATMFVLVLCYHVSYYVRFGEL